MPPIRLPALLALALVACGNKKHDDKSQQASKPDVPAPTPTPAPMPPAPTPAAPPAPAADALVEHDLSSLGDKWKGWKVDAPDPKATLEKYDEPFKGGVAIRWNNGGGAMGFYQGKLDFKLPKKDWKVAGDTKVDAETADELHGSMSIAGQTLKCFYLNMKVGTANVGCWTVSCVATTDDLALAKTICASLRRP